MQPLDWDTDIVSVQAAREMLVVIGDSWLGIQLKGGKTACGSMQRNAGGMKRMDLKNVKAWI